MTLMKQEKRVFILVILYIREYLYVFMKMFTGSRVSKDFQYRVSGSRNDRKRVALLVESLINPNPLGCVQNRIQIGGFGTVRVLKLYVYIYVHVLFIEKYKTKYMLCLLAH